MGLSSTAIRQLAPKAAEFGRITQNNGHYAVQGQTRTPILVPIEITCDFLLVINLILTYILSLTVSSYCWSNFRFRHEVPLFLHTRSG